MHTYYIFKELISAAAGANAAGCFGPARFPVGCHTTSSIPHNGHPRPTHGSLVSLFRRLGDSKARRVVLSFTRPSKNELL